MTLRLYYLLHVNSVYICQLQLSINIEHVHRKTKLRTYSLIVFNGVVIYIKK